MGRRVNEPDPEPVSPLRAVAGAAVAVAGVALGIGAVLMLTSDPDSGGGPTVAEPVLTAASATTVPPTTAPPTTVPPTAVPPTAAAPVTTAAPRPALTVPAPTTAAPRVTPSASPTVVRPPLTVLNNSRISKLADRAAARFRRGGYPIAEVGNYNRAELSQSTVYYGAGQRAAAQRLARAYDVPRVAPRVAGLPGEGLTVVLTRDYDV